MLVYPQLKLLTLHTGHINFIRFLRTSLWAGSFYFIINPYIRALYVISVHWIGSLSFLQVPSHNGRPCCPTIHILVTQMFLEPAKLHPFLLKKEVIAQACLGFAPNRARPWCANKQKEHSL